MKICIICKKQNNSRYKDKCHKCYDKERVKINKNKGNKIKCQCSPECDIIISDRSARGKLRKCATNHRPKGERNHRWNGGIYNTPDKYIRIYSKRKNHPYCPKSGYIPEHRLILEKIYSMLFGVPIYFNPKEFSVHHKNGDTKDNRPENLELLTNSYHAIITYRKNKIDRICLECGFNKKIITNLKDMKWYRHPITNKEWVCQNCYQTIRLRLKNKNGKRRKSKIDTPYFLS